MSLIRKLLGRADPAPSAERTRSEAVAETIERWQRIADASPDDAEPHLQLLKLCRETGDQRGVAERIAVLETRHSNDRHARLAIARHSLWNGDDERSLTLWRALDADGIGSHECANALATLCLRMGRLDEALALADALQTHHGDEPSAQRVRARACQMEKRWDDAATSWKGVLECEPGNRNALNQYVDCALEADRAAEALEVVAAALQDQGASVGLLGSRHRLMKASGALETELDAAVEDVVALAPDGRDARLERATFLHRHGRLDDAEYACEHLLRDAPDDLHALTLHARIAQARIQFERAA